MCLEMAVSCPPAGGESAPGSASGPSSRHLWKAGSVTTYTLPRSFSSVAGFGGPKLTWLRQKASSLEARRARRPSRSRESPPRLALVTCYLSPLHSQVKGESHASVCGSRSHALIPTGARSRPAALPKPIIISVPRPHCWKGSASKPYVELPPHTAPLGMEVGPAQACAVKVVVHDLIREYSVFVFLECMYGSMI